MLPKKQNELWHKLDRYPVVVRCPLVRELVMLVGQAETVEEIRHIANK